MSEQCQRQPQNVPLRKKILKKKKCKQQHQKPAVDENTLIPHIQHDKTRSALVVTLAMLWRLINCRIIIKHVYRRRYESRRSSKPKLH